MKTLFLALLSFTTISVSAQLKKDGTPDMRFNSNRGTSINTYTDAYSTPKVEKNYNNGGQIKLQDGYMKTNGTYVSPHVKTTADNKKWNNKSNW